MVTGKGDVNILLDNIKVRQICREAFSKEDLTGKKILVIIPDHSRTAPIDLMFTVVYELLAEKVSSLDFLVALGTHPPMSMEAIYQRVGITEEEHKENYRKARFFNHHWNDPDHLCFAGTITEDEISDISDGLMREQVDVTINKMVYDYDLLMIIGPTFPHEVVGFSGGNKYLFPGIAGEEIIHLFHWLGALITNPNIIGNKHTAVRKVVDKAASFLPMKRLCLSLVVKGSDLAGLYIGNAEEAWSAAADLSDQIHIVYKDKPYKSILSRAPEMYDDVWTGGKCMYKMEQVVADGGELIIYAPHISEVSIVHGDIIEKIGYHVRDYFTKQMDKFKDIPGGIMAHSTHVKGVGSFENGVEKPRVNVILATGISKEVCEKINLGYRDPASIDPKEWQNREDEGYLYVPKAGEILYRLSNGKSRE
jgi:nickel-dependent lactate racemase